MLSPLLNVYSRTDIEFVDGKKSYLIDSKGKKYFDFAAGIAVNSLGYKHKKLVAAMRKAAAKPWHVSNLYHIKGQQELAQKLVDHSGLDSVFFCNSGAEALETSFKMVRKYFSSNNQKKKKFITFEHAFHGRTIAAISAAGSKKYQEGYAPLLETFENISLKDLTIEKVKKAIDKDTAAIVIEPIQGEGGVNVFSNKFLKELRKLTKEKDIILIFDEVQCGMGRTGKFFHYQYAGIKPDIVCSAKGIGGGFPLGACIASKKYASAMTPGSHGGTYGGNPLAMAIGNVVVDEIVKPGFLENVVEVGNYLKAALQDLQKKYPQIISEIRGEGLLLGMAIKKDYIKLVNLLREEGILTVPASNDVIRVIPPLIITINDVKKALPRFEAALERFNNG